MPAQVILFSHPRTGCHFLERMLFSKQQNLTQCWHPYTVRAKQPHAFMEWMQQGMPLDRHDENVILMDAQANAGSKTWRETLENVKDMTSYMHEHPCFLFTPERMRQCIESDFGPDIPQITIGHTVMPSDLLLRPGTIPIFTIRHPVLQVQSSFKAVNLLYKDVSAIDHMFLTNMCWSRQIYDLYVQNGIKPVVVDADDYMSNKDFVRHIARKVGLDPEAVITSWPPLSEKERSEMHPMLFQIQDTLLTSTGLVAGRSGKVRDLTKEQEKWKDLYNEAEVKLLTDCVNASMPHYEYLKRRRLEL